MLEAVEHLRVEASDYITCLVTYPPFKRALRECAIIKVRRPQPFMIANWERFFSRGYVGTIGYWYLTLGDSDGDALGAT